MLFNTLEFGIFFVAVFGIYALLPSFRWQNYFLLAASYFFYACWDYRFLALIFISTTVDFFVGRLLSETASQPRRKFILFWSILFNLGFLGFFKYYNFFAHNLQALLGTIGLSTSMTSLNIILPVGISFYTFQSMSYTLDIYRGAMQPTKRFSDFALNVAFFPHMVAGPIQRANSLLQQICAPRQMTRETFSEGFYLILWGLFKKVVIADNLVLIVDPIFAQTGHYTATQVLTGMLAFAFQIYGDFSGYSDMARGTALMMGFRLMVNFNLPYFAVNPQDFWRRWHISLSTWLRDYLYVSLGGNRRGEARTYANLMLTMVLGGLWHGAAWTYVLWGVYHGLLLSLHRLLRTLFPGEPAFAQSPAGQAVWKWARIGFMFVLTLYGWLIFRATSFHQLWSMTGALFSLTLDPSIVWLITKILLYCSLLLLVELFQLRKNNLDLVRQSPVPVQVGFYLACFYLIVLLGGFYAQSFIYFQF
jgi:D-alanyl-lipoteichoic acid acyltransferase DltB (MBOAT superfamily)